MTALFIGARVPLVDLNTGLATPIWYRFFSDLFVSSGVATVTDSMAFEVAPQQFFGGGGAVTTGLADLAPVFSLPPLPDDNAPSLAGLQAEVAELRALVDDLRKGSFT